MNALKNIEIETLIIWIALISVVGVVFIMVLRELDVVGGDLIDKIAAIPQKVLGSIVAVPLMIFKAIGGWWSSLPTVKQ